MDGELDGEELRQALNTLKRQDAQQNWQVYHLIGDTLRKEPLLAVNFVDRVAGRLALEPTVLAPGKTRFANHRMLVLSVAASLSAVALVAWTVLQTGTADFQPDSLAVKQIATLPPPPATGENVNSYLMAHQEFSPNVAMQAAPYTRTVAEVKRESR
jgi:sigma-E factor negative regulatory protein RseA